MPKLYPGTYHLTAATPLPPLRVWWPKPLRCRFRPFHALAAALLASAVLGSGALANPPAASRCDFNNDGFDDLAVGSPGESVGSAKAAGSVNVIYGTAVGLNSTGNQLWHENIMGVLGIAESGDRFGASLACADFNLDGIDDLAIGAPGEDVGNAVDAGAVHVLLGSRTGLTASGNQLWHQDSLSLAGTAESGDQFGAALAAGDFDDDVAYDLAIGAPGENIDSGGPRDGGEVTVLYGGGSSGLRAERSQVWNQDSASVRDEANGDDLFGAALAAGDFDHDGFDDLAIGVPGEDLAQPAGESASDGGAVNVLNGSSAGLAASRDQFLSQDALAGAHEDGDHFGFSLASGDFNNDDFDDLAVGVPGEDVGQNASAGAVNVVYGSAILLTSAGNQIWDQDIAFVAGVSESADAFGASVATGDFNGDGFDDLAVGVPGEDDAGILDTGAVNVLFGSAARLIGGGSKIFSQNTASIEGVAEPGEAFGSSLAVGRFDSGNRADLAIGVPGESVGATSSAGAVNVLYGSASGPSGTKDQIWHQDSPGVAGVAEAYDRLGDQPPTSFGIYRIPYANGTKMRVSRDHYSHTPDFNELDLVGTAGAGAGGYVIVAAAAGTIMAIEDSNAEPTSSNNYVWIAHGNGEWTKYTHFKTGTVTALGRTVGQLVFAGTTLGIQGDVGQANGSHLHFEVAVPDDPATALDSGGYVRGASFVPLICDIPGNVFYGGVTYTAGNC